VSLRLRVNVEVWETVALANVRDMVLNVSVTLIVSDWVKVGVQERPGDRVGVPVTSFDPVIDMLPDLLLVAVALGETVR